MSDVPEGYKMSEVGVIPEEWEVKMLGEILQSARLGGNYQNSEKENNHPLMKMGNINRGFIDISKVEYITDKSIPSEKDKLQYGDVLFNTRNTLELVGKVAIWRNELPLAHYNSNLLRLEFNPSDVSSNFFINNILNTKQILSQLKRFATGTTSVAAIYTRDLIKLQIPLPPLPEQQAIASALSDVDALITALEQLITKKRNIKQGAMQQLLTGEKRLPGFGGVWEVMKLENVCAKNGLVRGPFGGTLKKEFFVRNGLKVYEQKNAIYRNVNLGNYFIDKNKFNELKRFEVKKGDFIVSCSGTIGKIYQIPRGAECGIINQALLKIKTDDNIIHDRFFFYYFDWEKFQEKIIDNTQGGAMQNLVGMNIFRNTQILHPPLPEQQAIAQILSDMDAEIEALEQKQTKYKAIKQGMMQELLTGKTRLV
jgi:type I restriction enzyme S subunit